MSSGLGGPAGEPVDVELRFYQRLIDLGARDHLDVLLADALALIVEFTDTALAYVELFDDDREMPRYWRAHGCSDEDVEAIRGTLSLGIIQAALAVGDTIETPSARDDERFARRASVRVNEIEAVLCAPVGRPPVGVVYLQGRRDGGPFTAGHRAGAEAFASQLNLIAEGIGARRSRVEHADHTAEIRKTFHCPALIGKSAALAGVLAEAAGMAPLTIGILITGASGTGKSQLARAIHDNSPRAERAFIDINCGAIPMNLIESELFGAERGSFTGAHARMPGKVAAARGGTLFLDEIGELPADAQVKLLQLLQERHYFPLGANQPVVADVRVIAATNADLKERMERGQFRADLYYRLHGVLIDMPGLAERNEDIPILVEHFCREACRRHVLGDLRFSRRALASCCERRWPGEIRQLANTVEAAVARAKAAGASTVQEHHLVGSSGATPRDVQLTYREAMRRSQRRILLDALEELDWNVGKTAERLDLARSHLYDLIAELELKKPSR
jgi:Nif-specific regulatory protein